MHPRSVLSLGNFFSSLHIFVIVYVITPYLAAYMPDDQVGLVVSFGAGLTLLSFPLMPRLVARFGARWSAVGMAFISATALLILAAAPPVWLAVLALALVCAIAPLIQYLLDLLLEALSTAHDEVSRMRALFTTAANVALIGAPLLIGVLMDGTNNYSLVFLAIALSLVPFMVLFMYEQLPEKTPHTHIKLLDSCLCVFNDNDLRAAALANGILQLFFHLAPLYVPLYLHHVLGMPWSTLGWVFAVMLIPFVIVEYPASYIADRWLGDKELLMLGFAIIGASFAGLAYVGTQTPLWILITLLVLSRVGAALVEAMVEGHFFRRISAEDANTVSLYRMTRPLAALSAPLIASVVLGLTGSYVWFFVSMGLLVGIAGIITAAHIKDVR